MKKSIADRVLKVVAAQLGWDGRKIVPESNLADDLGEDSIDRLELAMAIEEEFEIDISDDDAGKWETVGDVVAYISGRMDVRAVA